MARERTRSPTYSEGSAPIGATRPLLSISTDVRCPTRVPIEPTAAGRPLEGTPRQTRSMPASSISEAFFTVTPSGSRTSAR